ncbi:MAG: glutamine amidotransferase, partial [Bacteroides sp.]|nr:glutamine amidotransferase [Bacteroides sp.]
MKNEILYVLLPDFASHEMVYLMEAISSDEMQLKS